MDKNEWYKIGEDIKKQVQTAIDSNDFSQLSKTIGESVNKTVNGTVSDVGNAINNIVNEVRTGYEKKESQVPQGTERPDNIAERHRGNSIYRNASYAKPNVRPDARLFSRHPAGRVSGILNIIFGFGLSVITGIIFVGLIFPVMLGDLVAGALIPVGAVLLAGVSMGVKGIKMQGRVERFRRYVDMTKEKLYCSVEDMARTTGRNVNFVRRDIKKMMQKGMFLQAHFDEKETCLMVSNDMYEQYLQTKRNKEEEEKQKKLAQAEAKARGREDGENQKNRLECEKVVEEGKEYIRTIRICNDEIPGEEMSKKLDKLEFLVTRIFAQVEKEPELAGELRRMLSYYLPTTQKLVETYRDLDKQGINVSNVSQTKKEIEDTVDTINTAFEKFLDELFRDKAWDIQSDISVLNTMLKQDGYLEKDF